MFKAIKIYFKKTQLKSKIASLEHQVKAHQDKYNKCAICGAQRGASKIAAGGAFAGREVSGRLGYCPKCDCAVCLPCSTTVSDDRGICGIKCPRCGGWYDQYPYNKDIEEKKEQIVSLRSKLYGL
jgi:hypothetical protein